VPPRLGWPTGAPAGVGGATATETLAGVGLTAGAGAAVETGAAV
jgi:hypothetical protein